jgi:3-oxoacyl-[acyl-carrier protein] reductase
MQERKSAIVTGSATGVGAATALMLAQRGYDVLINYSKSEPEARDSEAACRAAVCRHAACNVTRAAAWRALVEAEIGRWKRLDALDNNAGVTTFKGSGNWDAIDAGVFQHIMGVNALGTFQMVRACAPHLRATRGAIVNVSSIAGALGIGSSLPYIASKGAVNAMTLHFARTLAPHVRVNAVCPGLITTRWFVDGVGQQNFEKIKANYEQTTPLQTAASAEDVADAVVWLIEGARTTTGELLMLDGGRHLGGTVPVPPRG